MIVNEYKAVFENGAFKDLFQQFISYKQGLGFKYGRAAQCCLKRLNAELNTFKLNKPVLTKAIIESLASKHGSEAPATQLKRICYLRHFASFLKEMGYKAYIYPVYYNIVYHDSFAPYIFSEQQIQAIILASDTMPFRMTSPKQHMVWPAFLRVLYGCGLRLSEALNLKVKDVSLDSGILFIEKSKNNTSRYVPMSESLITYLSQYTTNTSLDLTDDGYFFPAPDKGRYAIHTARYHIKRFYEKAGIPRLGNGRYPRVHDIRHTYSCHALRKMQENGYDLYYSLPILSAYLGHQGIRDTEKYLRLPIFQFPSVVEAENAVLNGIIPEVPDYEQA
jgi:integrase